MKKVVTSMILLLMLLSLSTSTFAHEGHGPYMSPEGTTYDHEHKVTSIDPQDTRHYEAVGGSYIGNFNNQEIPEGIVLIRYNPTDGTIKDTLYKAVPWKNDYLKSPTIPFPDSKIGATISASSTGFVLNQLVYKWIKHDYEIPPGKLLIITMYNEYQIVRVNLSNTYTVPTPYTITGVFTASESGHALVKKYKRTHINEYLLDGNLTEEQIIAMYPQISDN